MVGVVCKVVPCPFYCQGFCGNRMIAIDINGVCSEVTRAQRTGWEPHSLVDEYGSRPIITIIEKQEDEVSNDIDGKDSAEESDSESDCGDNTGDVTK